MTWTSQPPDGRAPWGFALSWSQFRQLVGAFLRRFQESDMLPDGVDPRQLALWVTAGLMTPPMLLAIPGLAIGVTLHPALYIGYTMTATALVTVVVWDAAFLDHRDVQVLGTQPVPWGALLAAKWTALLVVVVGLVATIAGIPAFLIALRLADWAPDDVLASFVRVFGAGLIASMGAGLFAFLSLIGFRTLLTLLLPHRLVRGVTWVVQLGCVVSLLQWVLLAIPVVAFFHQSGAWIGAWVPPLWFLGVYESIAQILLGRIHLEVGITAGTYADLARYARYGLASATGLAVTTYVLGARTLVRQASQPPPFGRSGSTVRALLDRLGLIVLRRPTERAIVRFVVHSIARSQRHRLILACYLGIALALILGGVGLLVWRSSGGIAWQTPTQTLLSVPWLLSFFVLVGLRVLFAIPTDVGANWVFRLTELDSTTAYGRAARWAMWLGLVPVATSTLPVYWYLWGPWTALGHTALWLIAALGLAEGLLVGFRKVPFTCPYVPGRANVKLLGGVYVAALVTYAYGTSRVEEWLLVDPSRWAVACVLLLLTVAVVVRTNRRSLSPAARLMFDDQADPSVQQLHLMQQL